MSLCKSPPGQSFSLSNSKTRADALMAGVGIHNYDTVFHPQLDHSIDHQNLTWTSIGRSEDP